MLDQLRRITDAFLSAWSEINAKLRLSGLQIRSVVARYMRKSFASTSASYTCSSPHVLSTKGHMTGIHGCEGGAVGRTGFGLRSTAADKLPCYHSWLFHGHCYSLSVSCNPFPFLFIGRMTSQRLCVTLPHNVQLRYYRALFPASAHSGVSERQFHRSGRDFTVGNQAVHTIRPPKYSA